MPDHSHITSARRVLQLEAEALTLLAQGLDERFVRAVDTILAAKGRVICTGIGKSGHVARKIAATMASTGTQAYFVHATEASHGDLGMIGPGDVILALSKTGETRELADTIAYAKRFGIPLIAMTASATSALGRAADILLLLPEVAEAADVLNAPTTSTTLQIALGDALAVALLERRGFTSVALSPAGETALSDLPALGRPALLLGAEGPGLPDATLARCRTVSIPMAPGFDGADFTLTGPDGTRYVLDAADGVQQIAVGGTDKAKLARLWVDVLGLARVGTYTSARENVVIASQFGKRVPRGLSCAAAANRSIRSISCADD